VQLEAIADEACVRAEVACNNEAVDVSLVRDLVSFKLKHQQIDQAKKRFSAASGCATKMARFSDLSIFRQDLSIFLPF
jgi:hypothetical protein